MDIVFLLLAQFGTVTLTIDQVCRLFNKAPHTIQNRVSAGTFPAPTPDGVWLINVIAAYLEKTPKRK